MFDAIHSKLIKFKTIRKQIEIGTFIVFVADDNNHVSCSFERISLIKVYSFISWALRIWILLDFIANY